MSQLIENKGRTPILTEGKIDGSRSRNRPRPFVAEDDHQRALRRPGCHSGHSHYEQMGYTCLLKSNDQAERHAD
jgi:hypothetical protein